jgi:hypothetical protein
LWESELGAGFCEGWRFFLEWEFFLAAECCGVGFCAWSRRGGGECALVCNFGSGVCFWRIRVWGGVFVLGGVGLVGSC